ARSRRVVLFLFLGRGLRRALGLSLLFLLGIAGLEHHRAAIDDLVLAFELERSRNADDRAGRRVTQGHLVFASEVAVAAGDLEGEAGPRLGLAGARIHEAEILALDERLLTGELLGYLLRSFAAVHERTLVVSSRLELEANRVISDVRSAREMHLEVEAPIALLSFAIAALLFDGRLLPDDASRCRGNARPG